MSGGRRAVFGLVLLMFLSGVFALTGPVWATDIISSASSVSPGEVVELSGSGFEDEESVKLCWDGEGCANLGRASPGDDGSFTETVTIPSDATAGSHRISACQTADETETDERLLCGHVSVSVVVPETTTTTTTLATTTTTLATTTTTLATTTTTLATTTTTLATITTTLATTTTLPPTTTTFATTTISTGAVTTTSASTARTTTTDSMSQALPLEESATSTAEDGLLPTGGTNEPQAEILTETITSDELAQASNSIEPESMNWPLKIFLLAAIVVLVLWIITLVMREIRGPDWPC